MDHDLDAHIGQELHLSPLVLYTFGYSWENDAWTAHSVLKLFLSMYPATSSPEDLLAYVNAVFQAFWMDSRRAIRADVILAQSGQSLFPRNSGEEFIAIKQDRPTFNRSRALELLREKNRTKNRKYTYTMPFGTFGLKDCYGKVIGAFGYNLLRVLFRKYNVTKSFPKDVTSTLIINILSVESWSEPTRQHYDKQMEVLNKVL